MSLPVPLSVLLITSRGAFRVTKDARDLTFRSTSPGGFASCRVPLDRPLKIQPDDVQYFGRMVISDTQTGSIAWEGQLEDPARSAGPDGQVWELTGLGPAAHAKDRTVPYVMVDQSLSPWVHALQDITPGATGDVRQDVGGSSNDSLHLQIPNALPVISGSRAAMRYDRIWRAEQKIARVDYTWDAGLTNADYSVRAVLRTDGSTSLFTIARSQTTSTAGSGSSPIVVVTNWPNGRNTLDVELTYTGAPTSVGGDVAWASVMNMRILAMRYDAAGVEKTTGYTANTVLASDVVADLLGRLLPLYDGATAAIATTSTAIDQLAYPDGITPYDVLADLMQIEAAYTWHAWERTSNDKHRFEWVTWPTTVRYEADIRDGYTSQGSADGLYDRVRVRWRAPDGQIRSTLRTQTVPSLASAGRPREASIDLGGELGSATNAQTVGDNFLADHLYPPNAGSLHIARRIRDVITGRTVAPWEIRPGNLIRVRGIIPRVDALNATGSDGVGVFRIVSTEFQARDASATLELDSYSRSTARALAAAASSRIRR